MFEFVKQVFITLLNFAGSLFRKCVSLSNQETTRCMKRPALVGINSNEPLYYPFLLVLISVVDVVIQSIIHML